jgi:4-amino-4-deoxy-L-arabinose transferase-like glycosyltransferase
MTMVTSPTSWIEAVRVRRWLFAGAAALSLLLCIVLVTIWIRSGWRVDRVGGDVGGRSFGAWALNHAVWIRWTDRPARYPVVASEDTLPGTFNQFEDFFVRREPPRGTVHRGRYVLLGFVFDRTSWPRASCNCTYTGISMPFYFLVGTTAVLPSCWFVSVACRRRRRQRAETGLCARCNYDLTGNSSGRCPECGAATTTTTTSTRKGVRNGSVSTPPDWRKA